MINTLIVIINQQGIYLTSVNQRIVIELTSLN